MVNIDSWAGSGKRWFPEIISGKGEETKKPQLFFGWYIVAASALLMTYSAGAMLMGFTAFVNPIAATFGWSMAQISLAMSLRGLESGALNPFLGVMVDRYPARRLVLIGVIASGLGLFLLSRVNSLLTFYGAFLVIGFGSSLSIQMLPMTMVARWFRKNIGKASGILALGTGAGGLFVPLLVTLIDTQGWRNALVVLAVGFWVLGIPLSLLFRNRPEEYGLLPDGKPPETANGSSNGRVRDISIGVREAIRMRAFWFVGLTMMLQIATINAIVIHLIPYLTSIGLERSTAGQVSMIIALSSMGARIPFGLLSDIFQKRYVMALTCGLLSLAAFLFWLIDGSSFVLIVIFAVIFGLGMGGFQPVRTPTITEYFGIRNFGAILGVLSVFVTVGMILAPPISGWVFDTFGYYDPVWLALSVISLAGAFIILTLPPPSGKPKPGVSHADTL